MLFFVEFIVFRSFFTVFVKFWFFIFNFNNLFDVNLFILWFKDFCGVIIFKNMLLVNLCLFFIF